ncbi:putative membrane protein; triplicated sequence [Pseudoalteromonas sp. JB197]|nr:putative membrane protein; triplicated sequence [Pseudoalteromonas sp. JB197]
MIAAIFTSYVLTSTASNYIILGLFVNACLTIAIYYDLYVLNNIDEWWLWSVYSIGVNVIDLLMIAVLFINKDFLGLIKLKRFIFNRNVLQQNQIDH